MSEKSLQDVFVHLSGQDDNLGDSVLRAAYLEAAREPGRRFHLFLGSPTSDYTTGLPLAPEDKVYSSRAAWTAAADAAVRPARMFNAGEINPRPGGYPDAQMAEELQRSVDAGGTLIVAGVGLRNTEDTSVSYHPVFRDAAVMSWRDEPSRDAAGFGEAAPDWAYALGTPTSDWVPAAQRTLLPVTLRFDRAWPDDSWFEAVRELAAATSSRIVTLAQVARDAPRAVRLAEELGGEYLTPPSMSHDDLDAFVREIYATSIAVVSDRAHALIIGATEGALPVATAADTQKLRRMLAMADLDALVGRYDQLSELIPLVETALPKLSASIDTTRAAVDALGARVRDALNAVA